MRPSDRTLRTNKEDNHGTDPAKQFLKELSEHPSEPKKCACGAALGPRVDSERKKIDGKEVCDDCFFDAIGAVVEQHPIGHGGAGHGQSDF